MKSFGIWTKECAEESGESTVNLHMNLWNIMCENDDEKPFIDLGIVIENVKSMEEMVIFFPFWFEEDDLQDLSEQLSKPGTVRMIFNESCDIKSESHCDSWVIFNTKDKKDKLLVKLRKEDGSLAEYIVFEKREERNEKYQLMHIKMDELKKNIGTVNWENIY